MSSPPDGGRVAEPIEVRAYAIWWTCCFFNDGSIRKMDSGTADSLTMGWEAE